MPPSRCIKLTEEQDNHLREIELASFGLAREGGPANARSHGLAEAAYHTVVFRTTAGSSYNGAYRGVSDAGGEAPTHHGGYAHRATAPHIAQ